MTLPDEVARALEGRLGPFRVVGPVGGGCVQPALRLETAIGPLFVKYGSGTPAGFFAAEAEGLRQISARAPSLRVPQVVDLADAGEDRTYGWMALEWLEPGPRRGDFGARLAAGLAELHTPRKDGWGWERPGFIGTLPQDNAREEDWAGFWRRRRLEPQLSLARASGRLPASERDWESLLDRLPRVLEPGERDGVSLLHGDLWGGNILATAAGAPAVLDPAAYRGHREVDLAMSELFGGFDAEFYREYDAVRPLQPGYRDGRRGIYQLYYLLVHVNLFGAGYVAQTAATLRSVLARTAG